MSTKETSRSRKPLAPAWVLYLAGLALVLIVLFHKSFLPDYVHFSNDAPLGYWQSDLARSTDIFGNWYDLNWIGFHAGAHPPDVTYVVRKLFSPVGFAKWFPAITLFILGFGAWMFFRQLKLAAAACVAGGLAATLGSTYFSAACWGVGSQAITYGFNFLAMALLVNSPLRNWIKLPLAGFAVGIGVMEGYDIGAIFSVLVGIFAIFHALNREGPVGQKLLQGIGRSAVVAACAGVIAASTLSMLVSTQIKGVAGMEQDEQSKAQRWQEATRWSLPPREAVQIIIPGIYGYRMDTQEGGNYWGAMGRDPAWDRYFANGAQGEKPRGTLRFSGGGVYAGVLVVLVALWAAIQGFRKTDLIYTASQRNFLRFWVVVAAGSMLLGFGRFLPLDLYRLVYALPYFSTMRNPAKFISVFNFALMVLFAYGVHGLIRHYMETTVTNFRGVAVKSKQWWSGASKFDKRWIVGSAGAVVAALFAWFIYSQWQPGLERHLRTVGYDDEAFARQIASFSIKAAGRTVLFLALSAGAVIAIVGGAFSGARAKWGKILLCAILLCDLGLANQPWIKHWNYKQKYASNPIIDLLRQKPYEQRVTILPFEAPPQLSLFGTLYGIEWSQHHFLYYNIQALGVIQMPRVPIDLEMFERAIAYQNTQESLYRFPRRWQLTNTRYFLGPIITRLPMGDVDTLSFLNDGLDAAQKRFRIAQRFNIAPKPGLSEARQLDELTAVPDPNGQYALFDFTGALPRAKLYSNWQVNTNDTETLAQLTAPSFDPAQTVLVADPLPQSNAAAATNQNAGSVEFVSYAPKHFVLKASANVPCVLLLNDKFDPNWKVTVDGKPETLLRCNFIMRGVQLAPGEHKIEFQLGTSPGALYVSLTAIVIGLLLVVYVSFGKGAAATPATEAKSKSLSK